MRNSFVDCVYKNTENNPNIYIITGDLGFGVLTSFAEKFPKQFINAGISEQNMTSVAAGMALEGKTVFTYSIANFSTLRCLEQIRNDVAYHNANVKIVSVGAGFAYGALGMSHHATEDIAFMRSLPNITIFTPCDPLETIAATNLAISTEGPCYIRLGRGGEPILHHTNVDVKPGKANILKPGKDTAIFVAGAIANEAITAATNLENCGISCAVYSFPTVKPIDKETILKIANEVNYIFTLEEHNIIGGFGGAVSEVIAENHTNAIIIRMGLNDIYTSVIGSQDYLRKYYGLDGDSIATKIKTILMS